MSNGDIARVAVWALLILSACGAWVEAEWRIDGYRRDMFVATAALAEQARVTEGLRRDLDRTREQCDRLAQMALAKGDRR